MNLNLSKVRSCNLFYEEAEKQWYHVFVLLVGGFSTGRKMLDPCGLGWGIIPCLGLWMDTKPKC